MTEHTVGIDISESHLDVCRLEGQEAEWFENAPRGYPALWKWLARVTLARAVFQATGPYHGAIERAFSGKLPLVKVNPLQARRFAQACGTRAKTDAVDARILARMGAAAALEPDRPGSRIVHDFSQLQAARTPLIKQRTRHRNRCQVHSYTLLKRQTKAQVPLVERQIAELDDEIARRIADGRTAGRQSEILCRIPDLGRVAAAAILTFLPAIGRLDCKQAASLAGLVPTAASPTSGRASPSSAAGAEGSSAEPASY